jgi:RNA polymerase sigma-70 factor (ECF subfamily)
MPGRNRFGVPSPGMRARRQQASAELRVLPQPGSPAPVDDAVLLAAVRAGDPTAAAAFCRRIRPLVERTVRRLLGRLDDDGQDLAQMAVIDLVFEIDRFRGECALDHWVCTVTAHIVYKHIRRRRLERRLFSRLLAGESGGAGYIEPAAPAASPISRSLCLQVLTILDRISDKLAWAFVLHDVCGYDLQEIAEITGVTHAAAQSRLVRGRRELHRRIGANPELAELLVRQQDTEGSAG